MYVSNICMRMYICVYYIYVCVYVCMCVCMYVCVCVYMYIYICIYICMYVYRCVCIYVSVCVCVCMYISVYVCIPFLTVGDGSENQSRCLDSEMVGHDRTLHTHKIFTFFLESNICNVLLLEITSFLSFVQARLVKRANSPLDYSPETALSLMRRR